MHLLGWLIFYLVTSALSYAVKRYIASRQKGLNEEPQSLPPVATGTPIPVLYGTQLLSPIPVWDGGEKLIPIKKQGQEIAKNHLERFQGILGWGEIGIKGMMFGDNFRLTTTRLHPTYEVDGVDQPVFSQTDYIDIFHAGFGLIQVFAPDIFAEFDGVGGNIYVHTGSGQNTPDVIVEGVEGAGNVPAYQDITNVLFDYFRMGMDRSRSINFHCGRSLGFGTVARTIDADAAAVAQGWRSWVQQDLTIPSIIMDLMTNINYGLQIDLTEIDLQQFNDIDRYTCGNSIFGGVENTGVSFALSGSQTDAKSAIDECLRVLNGILIRHPETNKYQIKLIRDEAPTPEAFALIRSFTNKQIRSCKVSTKEWSETINEVTIEWSNPAKMYALDTVVVRNDASISEIGYKPQKMSFRSVTDPDLAARIGIRELKAGSLRVERQTLKMTREAWDLERGDVFRCTYNKVGYSDRLLRVLSVSLGSAWSGEVTVETIDDIFSHDGERIRVVDPLPDTRFPYAKMPEVTAEISQDATDGHVTLTVFDPDSRIVSPGVEYQTEVGGSAPSSWTTLTGGGPYALTVARSMEDVSYIRWRYTWLDENGDTQLSDVREAAFSILKLIPTRTLTPQWTITEGGTIVVPPGDKCYVPIDFSGSMTKWKVQGTPASTSRFDLWRNNGGHALPTVADSLGLSFGPTAHEIEEGVFSPPIAVSAGDNFLLVVLSNDLAKNFVVSLTIEDVTG